METEKKMFSILSENGYKLTSQRRAILHSIAQSQKHFSSSDLQKKVRQECPGIGLPTIYRTLNILTELKVVERVHTGARGKNYIFKQEGHRHNLICINCGLVVDFTECDLEDLTERLSKETGFQIDRHLLQFFGTCRNCQKAAKKK